MISSCVCFLVFSNLQTSETKDERKLLPLSDRRVRGAPWRQKISSTRSRAIIEASIDGTGTHSTHFVKYSENTTTYRLPALETGNGPIMSQATRSKAS